jgi:hypothetical protein
MQTRRYSISEHGLGSVSVVDSLRSRSALERAKENLSRATGVEIPSRAETRRRQCELREQPGFVILAAKPPAGRHLDTSSFRDFLVFDDDFQHSSCLVRDCIDLLLKDSDVWELFVAAMSAMTQLSEDDQEEHSSEALRAALEKTKKYPRFNPAGLCIDPKYGVWVVVTTPSPLRPS